MAAEELFFGESTSGVSGDLKGATELACQMIGAFGMGTTLSSRAAVEMPGAGNLPARVLADDDAAAEVEVLLRESKTRVRTMLDEHRHVIEALRDALIDRDELIGYEILDVIVHAIPPVVVPAT